eukprot:5429252-Karenia_brevis.AAC.1
MQGDLERLQELRHPGTNHDWISLMDPSQGTIIPAAEFRTCLRHRLGCDFLSEAGQCHVCGKVLDIKAVHAGCCAMAQATKGHYAVVKPLLATAKAIDPTTDREEPGLTADDRLRPGDIITSGALEQHR